MSLTLPTVQPPRIANPPLFLAEFTMGLLFIVVCTLFADILGTAMYNRGFAKPFYILGRRIHHNCIYVIAPVSYSVLGVLFLLGIIQVEWSAIWDKVAIAGLIATMAMAIDFAGDKHWPTIRRNAVLHHEWIYTLVPAYLFTYIVHVAI